jgi:membrane AbrB-like protein
MGIVIGASFSRESLATISSLVVPVLVFTLLTFIGTAVLSVIMVKIFGWNFFTAFLALIPGGLGVMVILAGELKKDVILVTSLQTVRLLSAILVMPLVYSLVL